MILTLSSAASITMPYSEPHIHAKSSPLSPGQRILRPGTLERGLGAQSGMVALRVCLGIDLSLRSTNNTRKNVVTGQELPQSPARILAGDIHKATPWRRNVNTARTVRVLFLLIPSPGNKRTLIDLPKARSKYSPAN